MLRRPHFYIDPWVEENQQVLDQLFCIPVSLTYIQVAAMSANSYMATVFFERSYDRFIEIKTKLRKHKLHRMNQDSHFLGGSFGNTYNVRTPIQEKKERNRSQHLIDYFSSRTVASNL